MASGTLYIISTPIGNLEDITLRALRILREVSLIAAEDTRVARRLLNHFEISTPAMAYHEHNKLTKLDVIMDKLMSGQDVGLVSDAGTPCINDPGWELVRACIERGISVDALPGPASPIVALVLSGFPLVEFTYVGFPPRKPGELRAWFGQLKTEAARRPIVCLESPHRLVATLEIAQEVLGDRPIAVARELTKLFQEVRREKISESIAHFQTTEPRGEFCIVFGPVAAAPTSQQAEIDPRARLAELRQNGLRAKEAVEIVTHETGLPRRQIYDLWLKEK